MSMEEFLSPSVKDGLLLDTNLLVLFVVGTVNPKRIQNFKRTSVYDHDAYEMLVKVMSGFTQIYTVAHVMAEVSNLTDLSGAERREARRILAETIAAFKEPHVSSREAAESSWG
jgi:hypothetical protein